MTSLAFVLDRRGATLTADAAINLLAASPYPLPHIQAAAFGPFALAIGGREQGAVSLKDLDRTTPTIAAVEGQIHTPGLGEHTDLDRFVEAVGRWGAAAAGRLTGEFVGVHWDASTRRLLVIRDHVGVRPLHLHLGDDVIVGATEAASVLEHPNVSHTPDAGHLRTLLSGDEPSTLRTIHRDISRLPGGSLLEVTEIGARQRPYWVPSDGDWLKGTEPDAAGELIESAFLKAVDDRISPTEQVSVEWDGWQAGAALCGRAAWLVDRSERTADSIRTLAFQPADNAAPHPTPSVDDAGSGADKLHVLYGAPVGVGYRGLLERAARTHQIGPPLDRLAWTGVRADDQQMSGPNGTTSASLSPLGGSRLLDPGSWRLQFPRRRVSTSKVGHLQSGHLQHRLDSAALDAAHHGQTARFPYLDPRLVRILLAIPADRSWWASHGAAVTHRALRSWLPTRSTRRWEDAHLPADLRDQTLDTADTLIGRSLLVTRNRWIDEDAVVALRGRARKRGATDESIAALSQLVAVEAWADAHQARS